MKMKISRRIEGLGMLLDLTYKRKKNMKGEIHITASTLNDAYGENEGDLIEISTVPFDGFYGRVGEHRFTVIKDKEVNQVLKVDVGGKINVSFWRAKDGRGDCVGFDILKRDLKFI